MEEGCRVMRRVGGFLKISLGLIEKGIKEKKTIAILGNNTPRWTLSEIAIQSLGGVPLGLYSDALESEIVYLLDYSNCRTLFVEDEEKADKIMSLPDSQSKIDLMINDEPKGMNKYKDKRLIAYKDLVEIGVKNDYAFVIIADHGNADYALNQNGSPNTAHTTNPVPCFVFNTNFTDLENGKLADIAPTILKIMEVEIPTQMTGNILVK